MVAEVVLHDAAELRPGSEGLAQLRLADATLLLPGDRFIIRQFSPVVTIGGGVVLDAMPLKQPPQRLRDFLSKLASSSSEVILLARVARRGAAGLSLKAAVAETGWLLSEVEQTASALVEGGALRRCGDVLVEQQAFQQSATQLLNTLKAFHDANPLISGISKEELREKLGLPPEVFSAVVEALVQQKKLEITGEQARLAGRGVVMKDDEAESKQTIERAFAAAGLKVPALKDVLGGLKVDRVRAQKIVTLLLRDKVLVKLSDELVFHRGALEDLRRTVAGYKSTSPKLDIAKFKDLAGISRKYAIPLLEYLDRERVTRRVGDERVIL
jgi:selenocysteine-specific elongation factor